MAWPIAACRVSVSAKGVPSAACNENRLMPCGQPLDGREHAARFVGGERLDVGDDASAESGKLVLGHDIAWV